MSNISITYTTAGSDAISNHSAIKLTGMKVSNDGSTWIACTDCFWTGSVFCGTVTAPSDSYQISNVQVFFTDDSTVLCSGSGGPIATLDVNHSLGISFSPKDECKALISNTPGGESGGGGGGIDPAILDAKQDKVLSTPITFDDINQDPGATVEQALAAIKNKIGAAVEGGASKARCALATSRTWVTGVYYYKLFDMPNVNRNIIFDGNIAVSEYEGSTFLGASKYTYIIDGRINLSVNRPSAPISIKALSYGDDLPENVDILVTSDGQIYLKAPCINNQLSVTIGLYYNWSSYVLDGSWQTSLPEGTEVVASLSQNIVNASNIGQSSSMQEINIDSLLSTDTLTIDT